MYKRRLIICILLSSVYCSKAQQYGLFNTRTLFDGFENPAQKTFVLDSSRKFASNFLLPYFGVNAASKGNSDFIRKAINGTTDVSLLPQGQKGNNTVAQNANVYLFNLKIFNTYKYQKELGFSWQLRTDAHVNYTNETLDLFNNFRQLLSNLPTADAFDNNGYVQSYHQFSVSYRENYTKKLAFGVKFSILSGTSYNNLDISDSQLNTMGSSMDLLFKGSYRGTFLKGNEISYNTFMPNFKNLGASISLGTSYNSKSGFFIMANLKDLGFIRWNSESYTKKIDTAIQISVADGQKNIKNRITDAITLSPDTNSFYSATNAKADFMISKSFGFYTPGIIVSKNLFYKGGDAAFVNKFKYQNFSVTAIPTYNFNNLFFMGLQGMYQTPNFEVFLGSDDLFKTVSQAKGYFDKDQATGKGYNGAAVYFGLAIKFGNFVEHPQNSSTMPGVGDEPQSLFKRVFSIFSKKR
ncbi:DUF5723 family protein [Pedobacter caeni]|uniref:DUF5723 domain-containing protein n=1 Tax=Pedobacter caeni TaxID=288992 RepID=A0A1M5GA51_9SPHI|nr:DUF5723 family protein [Pedobacter caeni]SHG00647.1 hypothetical protein SAMN04488522_104131 [Pedobacter caeni]